MPGGDGTGPLGQGPFTGRGMGFCVADVSQLPLQSTLPLTQTLPTYPQNIGLRNGFTIGGACGFGRGGGRGRKRGRRFY